MTAVRAFHGCAEDRRDACAEVAIDRLGHRTSTGSGWLCTAIVGGALVPVIMGFVADRVGLQLAFFVPAVCYAYIAHYGLVGHVIRERS